MIRTWSKKISSKEHHIKNNKFLKIFGDVLHRREFWNLNKNSVSRGVSIGLFWAFVPVPFQMVFSTIFAFIFRGNIAIALSMVWLTNPLTIPVVFYLTYKLGVLMLGKEELPFSFDPSFEWMVQQFHTIVLPLLVGSLTTGVVFSILGYYGIRFLWFRSAKKEVMKRNKNFGIFKKPH